MKKSILYIFTFVCIGGSLDWKEYGVEDEVNRVLEHKQLGKGSIILFHNNTSYTPEALLAILEGLQKKGTKITSIDGQITSYKISDLIQE